MARSRTSFQKGCPGGPGRRRGSKNKSTQYREEISKHFGDDELGAVIKAMVVAAKDGDVQASKLLLSYRWGAPVSHVESKTEMSIAGSSAAAGTLASAFGIDELPTRPDDENEEFDDDSPEGSGGAIQHVEDSSDTDLLPRRL